MKKHHSDLAWAVASIASMAWLLIIVGFVILESVRYAEHRAVLNMQREEFYAALYAVYADDPTGEARHRAFHDKWGGFNNRWTEFFPGDYVRAPSHVRWNGRWVAYRDWIKRPPEARR